MIEQRKRNRGQGGFTLIELLVVIGILAVLGGVAVFAVGGLTDTADDSACDVERSTLINANQAALTETPSAAVSKFLDPASVSASGGNLDGKFWRISDTASSTNAPTGIGDNADGDCDSTTP